MTHRDDDILKLLKKYLGRGRPPGGNPPPTMATANRAAV